MSETKNTAKKMKQFYERHKSEVLWGIQILQDKTLIAEIQQALVEKAYDTYKKKVLYEEALDYASK